MKYCSTILVGLLCTAACLAQTPLPESRRTSPEIFIYKPDAKEPNSYTATMSWTISTTGSSRTSR